MWDPDSPAIWAQSDRCKVHWGTHGRHSSFVWHLLERRDRAGLACLLHSLDRGTTLVSFFPPPSPVTGVSSSYPNGRPGSSTLRPLSRRGKRKEREKKKPLLLACAWFLTLAFYANHPPPPPPMSAFSTSNDHASSSLTSVPGSYEPVPSCARRSQYNASARHTTVIRGRTGRSSPSPAS